MGFLKDGIEKNFGDLLGEPQEAVIEVCAAIGSLFIILYFLRLFLFLFGHIKRKGLSPSHYGTWSVVTGATDGIGKAYVEELAHLGQNVLMISRTQSKLDAVKKEVLTKYPNVKIENLQIDYSSFGEKERGIVLEKLNSLDDVGILINNVGVSYSYPMYFHELSENEVESLMTLNVNSTTWMTYLVLPIMVKQHKGCIVNIGSGAGLMPSPLLAQYSGAKSYIEKFSCSLHREYEDFGISVQVQTPLFIESKLSKQRASMFVPSAKSYVRTAMSYLGRDAICSPHGLHAMASYALSCLPLGFCNQRLFKMHTAIRKRALAKQARQKEAEAHLKNN